MAGMRLDKFLAEMGEGTRSTVKDYIRKGRVTVDGCVVKQAEYRIDTKTSQIALDGRQIGYVEYEYYMLNKPQGVLSATEDKKARTVIDLIDSKVRRDLFPVGRLDKDTEGLLLITNDGMLAHNLLSPKKHVDKVYEAVIDGRVETPHIAQFQKGIILEDGTLTMPSVLEILESGETSRIRLTIHEGKFHQVKRMFEAIGCSVTYLKRLSMGSLVLDPDLKAGEYRKLTEDELHAIKESKSCPV